MALQTKNSEAIHCPSETYLDEECSKTDPTISSFAGEIQDFPFRSNEMESDTQPTGKTSKQSDSVSSDILSPSYSSGSPNPVSPWYSPRSPVMSAGSAEESPPMQFPPGISEPSKLVYGPVAAPVAIDEMLDDLKIRFNGEVIADKGVSQIKGSVLEMEQSIASDDINKAEKKESIEVSKIEFYVDHSILDITSLPVGSTSPTSNALPSQNIIATNSSTYPGLGYNPAPSPYSPPHKLTYPVYNSTPPQFVPTSPCYVPTVPRCHPISPSFTSIFPVSLPHDVPTSPIYSPDYIQVSPNYSPTPSQYSPTSPQYSSTSPHYSPTLPHYSPTLPHFSLSSPHYNPTSPHYNRTSPHYSPASPDSSPTSTPYSRPSPCYSPPSPCYSITPPPCYPDSPSYEPATPVYAPTLSSIWKMSYSEASVPSSSDTDSLVNRNGERNIFKIGVKRRFRGLRRPWQPVRCRPKKIGR